MIDIVVFLPSSPFLITFSFFALGVYVCSECDHPLFSSHVKYQHETPWPAFTNPLREDSLKKVKETEQQDSSDCFAYKVPTVQIGF